MLGGAKQSHATTNWAESNYVVEKVNPSNFILLGFEGQVRHPKSHTERQHNTQLDADKNGIERTKENVNNEEFI